MGRRLIVIKYKTLYILVAVLISGLVLTMLKTFELQRQMQSDNISLNRRQSFGNLTACPEGGIERKKYWVYARQRLFDTGYLKHIIRVLDRLGYKSTNDSSDWILLWTQSYPFSDPKLQNVFRTLKPHQKVNKYPGTGVIVNKDNLATSPIRNIPIAFKLPFDKEKLLEHANEYPDKLWVQKNNRHRGIKIVKLKEFDLRNTGTFVQEYVSKPYLIDGRKFDIGIYVIMTSVDPLRVYVYEGDLMLRFCPKDYYPFDAGDLDKYVIAYSHIPTSKMPSLNSYYTNMSYTYKESLRAYIQSKGEDFDSIMKDMYDTIRDVYVQKEQHFITAAKKYPSRENFFELVRFDFILDEDLNVYLMEANMSPDLSSNHFKEYALVKEKLLVDLFSLIGLGGTPSSEECIHSSKEEADMRVSDRDIQVTSDVCASPSCLTCSSRVCVTCHICLSSSHRATIKKAFLEHVNKRSMKRVFPPTMSQQEAIDWNPGSDNDFKNYNNANKMMFLWFRGKCLQHEAWCH